MNTLLARLWDDDLGLVVGAELIFIVTILVMGCVTCLVVLREVVLAG
jgi:hypothetical protein